MNDYFFTRKDAVMYMKKIDELIASNAKLAELLGKKEEPEKKCGHVLVWVLAIIGAVAAIAAIAYGVYRYLNPDYLDDFDFDDFDEDYDDDFEDEEEIIEDIKAGKEIIVYDEAASKVYVANAKQFTSFVLFNAEGKQLRSVEGNVISLAGLPAGLYIVSYNGVLNAKILKK